MFYTLRFFLFKMQFFHNANLFGSCIIHILYTVCAKIKKKNNSGAKGLILNWIFTPKNKFYELKPHCNVFHSTALSSRAFS